MVHYNLIEEITSNDVTNMMAPLPTIKGRKCRTYFVVHRKDDYRNICMNVIRKFSDKYDIYKMRKGYAIGIFVVEK